MSAARRAYDLLRAYVNHEWERVRDLEALRARQELDAAAPAGEEAAPRPRVLEPGTPEAKAAARQVLAVAPEASFDEVRRQFERLARRADPGRFPEGSEERQHAAELLRQVTWAYQELTRDVPVTQKRFRSLEIE
jgi:hypothetical protein